MAKKKVEHIELNKVDSKKEKDFELDFVNTKIEPEEIKEESKVYLNLSEDVEINSEVAPEIEVAKVEVEIKPEVVKYDEKKTQLVAIETDCGMVYQEVDC